MMRYVVVVEKADSNWAAYVPDVLGCVTTGATREEVERNIQVALALYFEVAAERGEPIPAPGTWTTTVDVDVPAGAQVQAPRAG
jgi:predicted RNase H-like HicB family nuclease